MASSSLIAKRYAKALMSICNGVEGAKAVLAPLSEIAQSVRSSSELKKLFKSPAFSVDDKWKVLSSLSEKMVATDDLKKFLKVLAFNRRSEVLLEVEEMFRTQVLELDQSVEALVETALLLNDSQLAQLAAILEKVVSRKVKLQQKLSPELIAGIRVNILGKTLDASFASNLELVHRELLVAQA